MNPLFVRPLPAAPFRKAIAGAMALALMSCMGTDRVAGTSVGTGNPTEIEVAFQDDSGKPVAVTGALQVYAATQIPVPGLSPNPLVSVDVPGSTSALLDAGDFAALSDSLWPTGSVDNGTYKFNVVVAGQSQGAILRGFTYRKTQGDFVPRAEDGVEGGSTATIKGTLAPLVDVACAVDTVFFSSMDNYLFIFGTGFAAKGSSSSFIFKAIPNASHEVFLISVPRKGDPFSTVQDSLTVYGVSDGIVPGNANHLQVDTARTRFPTPDSLKIR